MPIYKYECDDCNTVFEELHLEEPIPEIVPCKNCKSENTHKVITPSSFHLKGTGWYQTDFAGNSKSKKPSN
jgi:putative FmdB family regulatory protein